VAQGRSPGAARPAVAAAGDEDEHNVLAHSHVMDALTDRHHPAHGLMPQGHGQRPDPGAVHHGQVRVAQAGVGDGHPQFAGAGFGPVKLLHH
jgi:hypothetical protein